MSDKHMKASERHVGGMVASELGGESIKGYTEEDRKDMWRMGKKQELRQVLVFFNCPPMTGLTECILDATFASSQPSDMQLAYTAPGKSTSRECFVLSVEMGFV